MKTQDLHECRVVEYVLDTLGFMGAMITWQVYSICIPDYALCNNNTSSERKVSQAQSHNYFGMATIQQIILTLDPFHLTHTVL